MLDGKCMEEINDRLKQAKHCAHLSFGGIAILLVGDIRRNITKASQRNHIMII
jgi:hypothetical protein